MRAGLCICGMIFLTGAGGGGGNVPVTVCDRRAMSTVLRVLSDWTLGAAAYPSKKLAMSVRRHTEGAR